jgi:two-component system response regulator HupR/HoxA
MPSAPQWTILVVDDEVQVQATLRRGLDEEYRILSASSGKEALQIMAEHTVDLILADQRMSEMTGVELFRETRVLYPEAIRVLITAYSDLEDTIRAINQGAIYQYVSKPWHPEQLRLLVQRAIESRELARRHRYLSRELRFSENVLRLQNDEMVGLLQETYRFDALVFASESMAELCDLARKAAATDLPVLIQGETGTGKELLARALHFYSPCKGFPFMAQNCGALPDDLLHSELFGHKRGAFTGAISDRLGLFLAADGGTVFLDEISEVSPAFQVSLLRFLQEGEVKPLGTEQIRHSKVRIIAASNRPLKELVESGVFRRDLYYRLRGFELLIPPLRERPQDIPIIAEHVALKYARSINRRIAGISPEVIARFCAYAFPGNVRELENEVRRMVALADDGDVLSAKHLSPELAKLLPKSGAQSEWGFLNDGRTLKDKVELLEGRIVEQALVRHRWNHSRAARELGLSRVGLANKIRRYNLAPKGGQVTSGAG